MKPIKEIKVPVIANTIQFPAMKYRSGGREWLVLTVQYKALGKFITTSTVKKKNQEILKADLLNRFLDAPHKNDIKTYIKEEKQFTIPPITLVSFENLTFIPFNANDEDESLTETQLLDKYGAIVGVVFLPIDYEFVCLDGNHRTVAIRELANENPELIEGSSIVLNIVFEKDKRKIRQDFVDVNKNVKATTPSINTLFNTRDLLARLVSDTIDNFDYLKSTTELLANSVSKNAKDIYTINNIKNAIVELSGNSSGTTANIEKVSKKLKSDSDFYNEVEERTTKFFSMLKDNYHIAICINNYDLIPEVRGESIITSGAGLVVCCKVFNKIYEMIDDIYLREQKLNELITFDWSRTNKFFIGLLVNEDGGITPGQSVFNLTANKLIEELIGKNIE